jgi:hypothetical protein
MYATPPNNRTIALPAALGSSSGTPRAGLGRGGRRRRTCRFPPSCELLQPRLQAAASGAGATNRRPAASEKTRSKRFIDLSSNRWGYNYDYICSVSSPGRQVKFAKKAKIRYIFNSLEVHIASARNDYIFYIVVRHEINDYFVVIWALLISSANSGA